MNSSFLRTRTDDTIAAAPALRRRLSRSCCAALLATVYCWTSCLLHATSFFLLVEAKPLPNGLFQARNLEEIQDVFHKEERQRKENMWKGRRRTFFGTLERSDPILAATYGGGPAGFYHSVASGDPTQDAVVIWTRYTPRAVDDEITLEFRMAAINQPTDNDDDDDNNNTNSTTTILETNEFLLDPAQNPDLRRGLVTVTKATDFVAKIDVTGLQSNTHYVYVFIAKNDNDAAVVSDIGLTRTAPAEDDPVEVFTYAEFSCAQFTNGFFHAYDIGSVIEDLDLAVFVGDYIYECTYRILHSIFVSLNTTLMLTHNLLLCADILPDGTYYDTGIDAIDQRGPDLLPQWETIDLQDYRNRFASYRRDEALQNLHRRVPIMAFWDDHELSDNARGDDDSLSSSNHEGFCLVSGELFPESWQAQQTCDRHEGDILERYKAAAQAFWEYLPIRHVPGSMGKLKMGSLTKIMEWGNLATLVGFDTRLTDRTNAYSVQSAMIYPSYISTALLETNVANYRDPNSLASWLIRAAAESDIAYREDESFTIIGETNFNMLQEAFERSKSKGKPWQIFVSPSMVGPYVLPDLSQIYMEAPTDELAHSIKVFVDNFLPTLGGVIYRLAAMLASQNIPHYLDDFSGYPAERRKLIKMFKTSANNVIVLGGDIHSALAFVLTDDTADNKPVAVNVGCTSVSAPGLLMEQVLELFKDFGNEELGEDMIFEITSKAHIRQMAPNCKVASLQTGGFTAVKATKESHMAEWFRVSTQDRLSNYPTARAAAGAGALTAKAICTDSATTLANAPGSLNVNDGCSAITFATERPALYSIPVPTSDDSSMLEGTEAFVNCGMLGCTFPRRNPPPSQAPTQNPDGPAIFDLAFIGPLLEFLSSLFTGIFGSIFG